MKTISPEESLMSLGLVPGDWYMIVATEDGGQKFVKIPPDYISQYPENNTANGFKRVKSITHSKIEFYSHPIPQTQSNNPFQSVDYSKVEASLVVAQRKKSSAHARSPAQKKRRMRIKR